MSSVKTIESAASQTIVTRPLTAYQSNSLNAMKKSLRSKPIENFDSTIEEIDNFDSKL